MKSCQYWQCERGGIIEGVDQPARATAYEVVSYEPSGIHVENDEHGEAEGRALRAEISRIALRGPLRSNSTAVYMPVIC
jgi:hypothetical protein